MSPSPELKQDRARRTRQALLRAASEAFAENGYRATSMTEIAARAKVAKGALTFHFPAKGEIAAAIVADFYDRWPALIDRLRGESDGPLDTIWAVLSALAEEFEHDPLVRGAVRLQAERNVIDVELPAPYTGWINAFTELYADARAAGELRPGLVPEELARITAAAFFGVQHVSDARTDRVDLAERTDELVRLLTLAVQAG
ncbi:ScbR family autoregulator-binding transcription factor [Actinoallomurus liliacearum]|uniref:ScbR family autoregulator-binding transcription factor n=1 Tax=Actinoallomurus liliacearum TaxID=1080073 RepID=A0ABP8TR83_9ACTN